MNYIPKYPAVIFMIGVSCMNHLTYAQTWTTTTDFEQGEFINLNPTTVPDQLQINTWDETMGSDGGFHRVDGHSITL